MTDEPLNDQVTSVDMKNVSAESMGKHIDKPADLPDLAELAQIIGAYNQVTEKLQVSHENMVAQVERLQRELASTDAALQRSKRLAALGQMAAGIAHEIRNPLAAIRLYAGFIVEDLAAVADASLDQTGQSARKIVSAVHGLDAIVNDVLSFSRDLQPQTQLTDLDDIVRAVIDDARPAIETGGAGGHTVVCDIEAIELSVDPALLRQALLNIVRNAAEAMRDASGVITIEGHRQGSQYVLAISDQGPGINEESVDRIFNPFFTTRSSGTGLGLAIVHRIVDAHGGVIVADNRAQGGARFELNLPIENASSGNTNLQRGGVKGEDMSPELQQFSAVSEAVA